MENKVDIVVNFFVHIFTPVKCNKYSLEKNCKQMTESPISIDWWCERWGCGRDLRRVLRLHRLFPPGLRHDDRILPLQPDSGHPGRRLRYSVYDKGDN